MGDVMLYLQNNSYYGSIIAMSVVGVLFVAYSIVIIWRARVNGFNICALGFLPVFHIFLIPAIIIRKISTKLKARKAERIEAGKVKPKKSKKSKKSEEVISDENNSEDEEIDIFG